MPEIKGLPKERLIGGLIVGGVLLALIITLLVVSLHWLSGARRPQKEPETSAPPTETSPEETGTTLPANPYGPEDFFWDGPYMTCLAGPSVLGIDVSTYQKDINWEMVRDAGVEFVMIRLGYRGSEQGLLIEDDLAQLHYAGAKAAGLRVGAYFFSQSISVEEAREEAFYALSLTQDWELDMPLVYDWEFISQESRTASMDPRLLTDCMLAFCQAVEAAGVEPMVYFNPHMAENMIYLEELSDYRFWLAMYNDQMNFPYKVDMWQYTGQGGIPGVNGDVDIDLLFLYE